MVQKSLNLITWWKHEIFFHMTYECNCLYETKCMDHYQKCKFALMICKTRCPADTNTNDVKKTCKKKKKQSKQNHGHWQYYKFLCISYISKYSNQVMLMY